MEGNKRKKVDKYLSMCVTRVAYSSYKCGDDTHACFLHRKTLSFYHKFDKIFLVAAVPHKETTKQQHPD